MKASRLLITALAVTALGFWAITVFAGDRPEGAGTSGKSTACSAAMAAKCTPEQAAACRARCENAENASGVCPHGAKHGKDCPHGGPKASAGGCCAQKTTSAAGCSGKAAGACRTRGTTSAAEGRGKVDAVVAGAGCSDHRMSSAMDPSAHMDCDACTDMAFCDGQVRALGAAVQVVPLKNGVMYVYTAEGPSKVQAVQAAVAHRHDRIAAIMAEGDKARLCPECKAMRGAVASGKLTRELVNIEGGCLSLMTSSDPRMVARIYAMAGLKGPLAAKS